MNFKIGHGYDLHRLVNDRPLVLCGVDVPFEKGLLGHSDADVAVHALMDAMLGAAALGDIGKIFPDTDQSYAGIRSMILLERVRDLLFSKGLVLSNADITIIAQKPKLRPYIEDMRESIAKTLNCSLDLINVKATTEEGLGASGNGEAISAHAVCLLTSV